MALAVQEVVPGREAEAAAGWGESATAAAAEGWEELQYRSAAQCTRF